jgi:hypothetical protein
MRAWLDDAVLEVGAGTLAAGLEAARVAAGRAGRVVIEATIDGHPIPESILLDPAPGDVDAEVRFVTADPAELVATTLLGVAGTLEGAKEDQREAAELIQTGRLQDAMERLQSALRTWETVRQAVTDGCSLLGRSPDEVTVALPGGGTGRVGEATAGLAGALGELKRALGAQDWSALADTLGFDMQDQADGWHELLLALAASLGGRAG